MPIRLEEYDSCPFCRYVARETECAFVVENELAAAFVNKTQYEHGGMLVIPRQHRETILDIEEAEIASVHRLAKQLARAAVSSLGAVAVNVFQNNGIKSGQHVPHYHVHVIPRYEASDPNRIFGQQGFPITPMAEQLAVAATIRAAL